MHFSGRMAIFHFVQFNPELKETFRQMLINKIVPEFTNLALFNHRRCFMINSEPEQNLFVFHTSAKVSLMRLFLQLQKYIGAQGFVLVSFMLGFF
jgi:hypothetical protein